MKRIMIALMLISTISVGFVGCGERDNSVRKSAQDVVNAFADKDMAAISKVVFGTVEPVSDSEMFDTSGKEAPTKEGVLSIVFERVAIEVGNITDSTIEYEVSAPDMGDVFAGLDASAEDITEAGILEHVREYAEGAKLKKTKVALGYELVSGKPIVNYRDERFVDAVTGGLLGAYEKLYATILDEYAKGLE